MLKNTKKPLLLVGIALFVCIMTMGSVSASNTGNTTNITATNVTNSTGLADSDWPSYHNNANSTGQSNYTGPQTNTTKWTYENLTVYGSAVIGSDGTVYVGGADGVLYAFYPNGRLKWTWTTRSCIMGSPTIGNDGTIYVSNWMNSTTYAIAPDGTLLWKCTTGDYNSGSSPVIGSDGTIYVTVTNDTAGTLYAISNSGTIKWKYTMGVIYGTSPVIGSDGTIYLVDHNGIMYAINRNGTLKWSFKLQNRAVKPVYYVNMRYNALSIGPDGTIYVANSETYTVSGSTPTSFWFYLFAIVDNGSSGSMKWIYTDGWDNHIQEPVYGVPAISSDGKIYVVSASKLYAIDSNGNYIWNVTYDDGGVSGTGLTSAVIGADGTIYVGGRNGLYALNPDKTLKWSYATGEIVGSPAIGSDGTLYVGTTTGKFYAFNSIGADFNMTKENNTPFTEDFSANSTGNVTSWKWDFGDGNTSTEQNPKHTYNTFGVYKVVLTVTLNNGNLLQITKILNIEKVDLTVPTVNASLPGGTYTGVQNVTLNATDDSGNATIYFTTDCTDPQNSATRHVYTNPLMIGDTTTLKFAAVDPSGNWSPTYTKNYNITVKYVKDASYYINGSLSDQIQAILDGATSGDTIVFQGSEYYNLHLIINKRLNIITSAKTKIITSGSLPVFLINGTQASGTTIIGFNITTSTIPGILINNTSNATIYGNSVSSTGGSAIMVNKSSSTNIYYNDVINSSTGINVLNSNNTQIFGNLISGNSKIGVFIYNSSNTTVNNSAIIGNGNNSTIYPAGIYSDEGGIYILDSNHVQVVNNDISYNCQGVTVRGDGPFSSDVLVDSNIISDNYGEGVLLSGRLKNISIMWNYIQRNANGVQMDYSNGQNIIVQSNLISDGILGRMDENIEDSGNGITFGRDYQSELNYQTGHETVQYNVIYGFGDKTKKEGRYVDAHDANINLAPIGLNVYEFYFTGDDPSSVDGSNQANFCCKLRTEAAKLVIIEVAPNIFVADFQDSQGNSITAMIPKFNVTWSAGEYGGANQIGQPTQINSNELNYVISATWQQIMTRFNAHSVIPPNENSDKGPQKFTYPDGGSGDEPGPSTPGESGGPGGSGGNSGNGASSGFSSLVGLVKESSAAGSESSPGQAKSIGETLKNAKELFINDVTKNPQLWALIGIILLLLVIGGVYYRKDLMKMIEKSRK